MSVWYFASHLIFLEAFHHDEFLKVGESLIPVSNDRGIPLCPLLWGWWRRRVGLRVAVPVHWVDMDLWGQVAGERWSGSGERRKVGTG